MDGFPDWVSDVKVEWRKNEQAGRYYAKATAVDTDGNIRGSELGDNDVEAIANLQYALGKEE